MIGAGGERTVRAGDQTVIAGRRPTRTPRIGLEARRCLALLGLSVVLALISLLISRTMGYDQEGWAVYARELFGHGSLDTNSFPAWKPLPILLMGPVTWFTHGQLLIDYWLLIARVCAFMTVFGAAVVAYRMAGWWAAGCAAILVLLSSWWLYFMLLGLDAIPAAAMVVGAVYAAQLGKHRWAIVCLICLSLLRPEGTVFVACYSFWAWRNGHIALWEAVLSVLVIVGLWAVPEILHSGKSSAALSDIGGTSGTPITTGHPFRATLTQSANTLGLLPTILVAVAVLSAIWGALPRGRGSSFARVWGASGLERALLVFGLGWILIVALETLHGFSGNWRYNVAGIMALTLVAAVTAVRLARWLLDAIGRSTGAARGHTGGTWGTRGTGTGSGGARWGFSRRAGCTRAGAGGAGKPLVGGHADPGARTGSEPVAAGAGGHELSRLLLGQPGHEHLAGPDDRTVGPVIDPARPLPQPPQRRVDLEDLVCSGLLAPERLRQPVRRPRSARLAARG